MIALLEVLLIIFIISFAAALIVKKNTVELLPVTVMGMVTILYVSGFLGNLKIGFYVILGVAAASILCVIYGICKEKTAALKRCSFGLLIYLVFALWLYRINNGRLLNEWDEFTHWGFTVKIMTASDAFSNAKGSTLYFVDYPPGTALFQYFVQQFLSSFNEGFLSIAEGLMLGSFIVPLCDVEKISIKNIIKSLITTLILFTIPMGFYSSVYSSVYVDVALAIVSAYILYTHFTVQNRDVFYYVKMSLAFGYLCIIKPSGIGLMVIFAIVLLADNIYNGRYNISLKKKALVHLGQDIIPVLVGFVYKKAWSLRLDALGYSAHFDTKQITLKGIFNVISGNCEEYQTQTLKNFYYRFMSVNTNHIAFSSMASYALLFIAATLLLYRISSEKRYILFGIMSIVMFMVYSAYMLVLYLFTFSASEAVNLASFDRYEYTIILGFLMGMIMIVLAINKEKRMSSLIIMYACILFIIPEDITYYFERNADIQSTVAARACYEYGEEVAQLLSSDDKVYIISQESDGYDYFVLRYILSPVHTQVRLDTQGWKDVSWYLGEPRGVNDDRRRNITPEDWVQYLMDEDFDYVLLYHVDEQFISEYSSAFEGDEIGDNRLYYVDRTKGKLTEYATGQ